MVSKLHNESVLTFLRIAPLRQYSTALIPISVHFIRAAVASSTSECNFCVLRWRGEGIRGWQS